jgi:hypothetical protein
VHSLLFKKESAVEYFLLLSWLLSPSGDQRALLRKRRHQGKWVCKQDLTDSAGQSSTGLARVRSRRGRIRDRQAKPAGMWAQASKRKIGDQEVAPAIYARSLLGSGLKVTGRNRRVSSSLSPIFYLFLLPAGVLYQKVQHLLAGDELVEKNSLSFIKHQRHKPKRRNNGIPSEQWPTVIRRVVEQK